MRVLLLNQAFYPDVAATGQYLADLACELIERGHAVTVITSRRAYDNPQAKFAARDTWRGVDIRRVWATGFGKNAKWKRASNFVSFIVSCAMRLFFTPRPDVVVALTSPPLISFIGAAFARWHGCRFVYWVMDLNPDEAIAAGWLNERSLIARALNAMSVFSFRRAKTIVVLDRFMRDRVLAKGIAPEKTALLPPWSHDDAVQFDAPGRDEFRATHGLTGKFVVMYSGNHSPCHPLTTLLAAAQQLCEDERLAFCFVGGGSEFAKVKQFAAANLLQNILCLPYQPLEKLSGSLSAADLHVVVMGDAFVGMIHPCKLYNILNVEAPVLYFGPAQSHIADIVNEMNAPQTAMRIAHGDVPGAIKAIRETAARRERGSTELYRANAARFSKSVLLPELIFLLEKTQHETTAGAEFATATKSA